jgi:hypothetical protein
MSSFFDKLLSNESERISKETGVAWEISFTDRFSGRGLYAEPRQYRTRALVSQDAKYFFTSWVTASCFAPWVYICVCPLSDALTERF